jgi:poly-gamma-glutamate synthase PgsB/CapB
MLTISVILILIFGLLFIEKRMVQKSIRYMSLRIHVNGTRGKSSVTEYVAAGISFSRQDVMAKITGIIPTIIHNGVSQIIVRHGVARVQEQINILLSAFRRKVKVMVLECMSISPELMKLEGFVFQPHIYVITNIRDDHREEMGKDVESQAEAICNAIPANCKVITNEKGFLKRIKEKASAKNSTVITTETLEDRLRERLPYEVFPENVALALAVCREAGIDLSQSETGIMNWISKSTSPLTTIHANSKNIRFLNAFSVNDIDSTKTFLSHWETVSDHQGKLSVILNTRADRPVRTDLFSEWIAGDMQSFETIILTGNHKGRAKNTLLRSGVDRDKVKCWTRRDRGNLKSILANSVDDGSFVAGVGNIGGEGFNILNELR